MTMENQPFEDVSVSPINNGDFHGHVIMAGQPTPPQTYPP